MVVKVHERCRAFEGRLVSSSASWYSQSDRFEMYANVEGYIVLIIGNENLLLVVLEGR